MGWDVPLWSVLLVMTPDQWEGGSPTKVRTGVTTPRAMQGHTNLPSLSGCRGSALLVVWVIILNDQIAFHMLLL